MTLVIMAAGMGSRFGGLKQIEPVGKNGEFILDFSIYDAIKNGFDKVVFIIKEENYDIFRDTIGKRIEDKIKVEYVFQKNDNVPEGYSVPVDRVKPLGTAHAILSCKDIVKEDFMIINADDFYGKEAFEVASSFLKQRRGERDFAMVGYQVGNTVSSNGTVKRGVCQTDGKYLSEIVESTIITDEVGFTAEPLNGEPSFKVGDNDLVSMNMLLFTPKIFEFLEEKFVEFFEKNKDDMDKAEYLIPEVLRELIKEGRITLEILPTKAVWMGITYREDKEDLVNRLNTMIDNNIYPEKLWN